MIAIVSIACPCMQEAAGPEWDHIDHTTLKEVERSWAHSRCQQVMFDLSNSLVSVCMHVARACYYSAASHHTKFLLFPS